MKPLFFILWLGAYQQDDGKTPVFRFNVEVHTVYADVFVKRDGDPVAGLTAGDFQVWDNGVPQDAELVNHQELPIVTLLLLDISGSVTGDRLAHLRTAAHAFIERMDAKDEVGLLTFTRDLQLRLKLGHDQDALHRMLEQPMPSGETSLYDALFAGLKLVEDRPGRPLILLFTDGLDNMSWLTATEILDVVKVSDAVVYAVCLKPTHGITLRNAGRFAGRTTELDATDFLKHLTGLTGGRTWDIDTSEDLTDAFLSVLSEMQSRYLLSYSRRGMPQSGWHSLKIRVKDQKADRVRARPGYFVEPQ